MGLNESKTAGNGEIDPDVLRDLEDLTALKGPRLRNTWSAYVDHLIERGRVKNASQARHLALNPADFRDFLNTYFRTNVTETFSDRLFKQADSKGQGKVKFEDIVAVIALLDSSSASDKLDILFKSLCNEEGLITEKELPHVLQQIHAASDALGYHTKDLISVVEEEMAIIMEENKGCLTADAWDRMALESVPISVLFGFDAAANNVQKIRESHHLMRPKRSAGRVWFCSVCDKEVSGPTARVLRCSICRYVSCLSCSRTIPPTCRPTYTREVKANVSEQKHHWVKGNFNQRKCLYCAKPCGGYNNKGAQNSRCSWCKYGAHKDCIQAQGDDCCRLGGLADMIIPDSAFCLQDVVARARNLSESDSGRCSTPTHEYSVAKNGLLGASSQDSGVSTHFRPNSFISETGDVVFGVQVIPERCGKTPVLVFVNPASGGNQGKKLMEKLKWYLNPRQIYDLKATGPGPGLKLFSRLPNLRIICAGGDGTAGWVLSALDKLNFGANHQPAVTLLPLGTGNDFARTFGWGGGYSGESLGKYLYDIGVSNAARLNRWSINFSLTDPSTAGQWDKVPLSIINNYFSFGTDAVIAHKFHTMREKHPEKFNSRIGNKLVYFKLGNKEFLNQSTRGLWKDVTLWVDGYQVDLAKYSSLQGLAFVNIPSMYGGVDMWGTPSKENRFGPQSVDDGMIEVVGIMGSAHLGSVQVGVGKRYRVAQGSKISIEIERPLPFQIDGEPFMLGPCTVDIELHNTVPVLRKKSAGKIDLVDNPNAELRRSTSGSNYHADDDYDDDDLDTEPSPTKSPDRSVSDMPARVDLQEM
eukprot:Clim_evm152s210 gene=Clim_evmTU152s210